MKVQSTGLGKTVMLAHFQDLFKTRFEQTQVLQMNMESTEPLHWTIKVYMEPKDLRKAVLMGLKPSIIWKAFLAIVFGRFSLFGGAPNVSDDSPAAEPIQPIPSGDPGDRAANPLAGLKSGSDETDRPNPLASLKG